MITIDPATDPHVLVLRIDGRVTHEDYARFVPILEAQIEREGQARCLFEMDDWRGLTPRALWDEVKFDVTHGRQVGRCAVVGGGAWLGWLTRLARPIFPNAEIRTFDAGDRVAALAWVREGT